MTALQKTEPLLTFDDYLAFVDKRPDIEDWELIEGALVLMTRPIPDHAQIVMNIAVALRQAADKRGCRVLADLLVRHRDRDDYAVAPDVLVRCGPPGKERYVTDPVVVVEVLSPSTMDYDRGLKLGFYKSMPSVEAIVLVYQTERRLEMIRREGEDWAMEVVSGEEGVLSLAMLAFAMPIAAVYEGVDLAA